MTAAIEPQLNKAPSTSAPPKKLSERLKEAAKTSFIGRQKELSIILDAIESDDPPFFVAYVHGPGGIGKSRLIHAAIAQVDPAINRYVMDCRQIEPTPQGFQIALAAALELQESEPDFETVVNCLAEQNQRSVIALDTYETFGLMDTWLRQEFLPSLCENVVTIIAGREAPNPAWLTTPGWSELFREIKLGELSKQDTNRMLESRGLQPEQIKRVCKFAHGYPLALEMAAAALSTQPDLEITEGPPPKILQQLTDAFLSGLAPEIIAAVAAASTVRRIIGPLLGALLAVSDVRELYNKLQELPFIDATSEGLVFQDVVRETISKELQRRDPDRFRCLRNRAYSYFTKQSHRAAANTLWQYTADLLYMIENPIARGAFFPEGASELRVEPATANSIAEIHEIIDSHEPEKSGYWFKRWLDRHPETFSVARSPNGRVDAFYFTFEPENVAHTLINEDPFTSNWLDHLDKNPLERGERVLFLPRWLDRKTGENPSAAVGSCFLDIKRTYLELRPGLRKIYTAVTDWDALDPEIANKVGHPLSMHSGINTGLVVTGEVDMARGTHGVAGDTINVAARLSAAAGAGDILVDHKSFTRAEGYFEFEDLEPIHLKGKTESIQIHKFLSFKDKPQKIHRLHGLRADLIGRKAEMAQLVEAFENLKQGRASVISIIGSAATGKSRLVQEFKSTLDPESIQWMEGHAYPYTQNIPYFLLIDLFNRIFQIKEGDSAECKGQKIEAAVAADINFSATSMTRMSSLSLSR